MTNLKFITALIALMPLATLAGCVRAPSPGDARCAEDAACGATGFCVQGQCVACRDDSTCPSDHQCRAGECRPDGLAKTMALPTECAVEVSCTDEGELASIQDPDRCLLRLNDETLRWALMPMNGQCHLFGANVQDDKPSPTLDDLDFRSVDPFPQADGGACQCAQGRIIVAEGHVE